jgi:hypothetical protein
MQVMSTMPAPDLQETGRQARQGASFKEKTDPGSAVFRSEIFGENFFLALSLLFGKICQIMN